MQGDSERLRLSRLRLVVVDVDGCLTPGEARPWNFEALKYIAQLNRRAQEDATKVAVTLCTGRQEPYVEVLMQAIDAHLPGIYENGGGLYFPRDYRFVENPIITTEMREALVGIKATLQREVIEAGLGYFQPGKEVSLTLYPLDKVSVHRLYLATAKALATCNAGYIAQESVSCVDVVPKGIDKGGGVRWLSQETGISLDQIGGIGDSVSDLKFLSILGCSAAPANAAGEVKTRVDYVSPYEDGDGVVDILCHWSKRLQRRFDKQREM